MLQNGWGEAVIVDLAAAIEVDSLDVLVVVSLDMLVSQGAEDSHF